MTVDINDTKLSYLMVGGALSVVLVISTVGLFVYNYFFTNHSDSLVVKTEQLPIQTPPPANIRAIMNNNVKGVISQIDDKTVIVDTKTGQEAYSLTNKSFVSQTVDNHIINEEISYLKKGMNIYIQFDPNTNEVLTITIN